jgi:MFS transporter, DHA1 family, multidrug resistance protein
MFTALSSVWAVVYGLLGPFYAVYIANVTGGLDKLGFAFSIMILVQAATSYIVGHYSDKLGRKPFLFLNAYLDAIVLILYTIVDKTYQIYILQAVLGATNAMSMTVRESLMGDLTRREDRGATVGKLNAIVSIFAAAGLALGGYMAKLYGLKSIFYLGAAVITFSTALLFFIQEPEND